MADTFTRPDVLVLAAGGVLGVAWTQGVLAGIEEASGYDFRTTESLIGTSAGSIVAASLVAGRSPSRPADGAQRVAAVRDEQPAALRALRRPARVSAAVLSPWAGAALALSRPGGRLVRAAAIRAIPAGERDLADLRDLIADRRSRWDGRLRVCAVDRTTGARVVFGAPGAPKATVPEAVAASCSVPWINRPVRIGDRDYVDGGVWSVTNLDVAPAGAGTRVLCLDPTASFELARTSPYAALRAAATAMTTVEALSLRARGAHVRVIGPSREVARTMGRDLSDERRRPDVLAGAFAQGLGLGA